MFCGLFTLFDGYPTNPPFVLNAPQKYLFFALGKNDVREIGVYSLEDNPGRTAFWKNAVFALLLRILENTSLKTQK